MQNFMKASVVVVVSLMKLSAQNEANPVNLEFHHVTASVGNMDRAIKWYQEKLGFKTILHKRLNEDVDLAWLVIPGFRIDLIKYTNSKKVSPVPSNHLATQGWTHIVFSVPNVDKAYAVLQGRGVDLPEPVVTLEDLHIRTSHFPDSEGNWLEIYQDVPAKK